MKAIWKNIVLANSNDTMLTDGEKLCSLMLEYNKGVCVNWIIELKKISKDFFME